MSTITVLGGEEEGQYKGRLREKQRCRLDEERAGTDKIQCQLTWF